MVARYSDDSHEISDHFSSNLNHNGGKITATMVVVWVERGTNRRDNAAGGGLSGDSNSRGVGWIGNNYNRGGE